MAELISRGRHPVLERTSEDAAFSDFLGRQKVKPAKKRAPRIFLPRDFKQVATAARKVSWAARRAFFLKGERKRLEKILELLPDRMRAADSYRRVLQGASRRGRPLRETRRCFLLMALLPYAKATKGKRAWAWVHQELAHLGENIPSAKAYWTNTIAPRAGEAGLDLEALMRAAACAHFVYSECRANRIRPGTPLAGRVARLINDETINSRERSVLRAAAALLPHEKPHEEFPGNIEDGILLPTCAWDTEWVA